MLKIKHLSKSFSNVQAVKDVSFHVKKGSTFSLLGTNGAGKSTIIHLITNLLKPDKGVIEFSHGDVQNAIGVVFQSHRLDDEFTIEENLMLRAKLHRLNNHKARKRIDQLLRLTNLVEKRKRLYGNCSGGEKRKTDIIRALLHEPNFLILDEPTTGLDAESRKEIWAFLQELQSETDLTIFLTTHYIEEVEKVDYVLIMHEGKIEVEGTPDELRKTYAKTTLKLYPSNSNQLISTLQTLDCIYHDENHMISIPLKKTTDAISILHQGKSWIQDFSIEQASLEQVFLSVTQQMKDRVKK